MQRLTFDQSLLLMEAMSEFTDKVRDRVAAGETHLQQTLDAAEAVEALLDTGTVHIEPTPRIAQ